MLTFRGTGLSMLPAIFPRDTICARPARAEELVPGAIVSFLRISVGTAPRLVTHRIMSVAERTSGTVLEVRGDAQQESEWIEAGAVTHVVIEVDGRMGRWSVYGRRGRILRSLALSSRPLPNALRQASVAGLRWVAAVRTKLR